MINLRYHIVSLTAVFLALGIGLTLGSTFLDRVTVDTLKNQLDTVEAQVRETNAENEALRARVDALEGREADLAAQLPERLLEGHLDSVPVLVVAAEGTDEDLVDATVGALRAAGAEVAGTWWLTNRWSLDDADEVGDLATILGVRSDDPDRLRRNGAIQVSELLVAAAEPPPEIVPPPVQDEGTDATLPVLPDVPVPEEPDLVAALVDGGFVAYEPPPDTDDDRVLLPGASARYVVVSGAQPDSGPHLITTAIVEEVVAEDLAPIVAAQGAVELPDDEASVSEADQRATFVGPLRDGEMTRDRLSTVDHLDTAAGLAATVLALEDLEDGRRGHYGVGAGASRLLPEADSDT